MCDAVSEWMVFDDASGGRGCLYDNFLFAILIRFAFLLVNRSDGNGVFFSHAAVISKSWLKYDRSPTMAENSASS